MVWHAIWDLCDARNDSWASSRLIARIFATKMLPLLHRGSPFNERAQAHVPAELMMHIASCLGSDADRQTLRMLNRQWKAAVDDSVSRMSGNMYTVCDKDLEALQAYKQLQSLDLSQCRALTDLTGIQSLPKLQSLELNCCKGLKGAALRVLAQLPCLQKLDLSCCSGLTDDCLPCITGIRNLEWLSMQGCTGISAAGLGQLQQCMRLRYLDLSETQVVGLGFLQLRSAPEKGQQMAGRTISIQADSSSSMAASTPSYSSEWRCSLRRLRLADCEYLAESALGSLIGHAELETLDLSRTTQVLTGASVAALQQLGGLRRLNLEGSPDFCDDALLKLTALHRLTHLDVSECQYLSPGALSTLRQRMPSTCAVYSATS